MSGDYIGGIAAAKHKQDMVVTIQTPNKKNTYPEFVDVKFRYEHDHGGRAADHSANNTSMQVITERHFFDYANCLPAHPPTQEYHVWIDYDHSDIGNEGTKDKITLKSYNYKKQKLTEQIIHPTNPKNKKWIIKVPLLNNPSIKLKDVQRISIETNGTDGFFIDKLELYKKDYGLLKQWGRQNGKGWCASKDPKDAKRSWKGYTNACYRKWTFKLNDGRGFPAN